MHCTEMQPNQIFMFDVKFIVASLMCKSEFSNLFVSIFLNLSPTGDVVNTYSSIYPTRCNVTQFILSGNCSTCFGWYTTHDQERQQLYLQHLVFVTPLLLSAAIVEELELVLSVLWVAYATHSTLKTSSNSLPLALS